MAAPAQYDVVIVGASIAGCTAAALFGRRGAKVALIEREKDPGTFKKVCTHYIQPSATPTIEKLGLGSRIEAAGGIRNEIESWTRWGWIRQQSEQHRGPRYGYNIRREKPDPMLRDLAANTPGVDFMPGQSVQELIIEKGRPAGVGTGSADAPRRTVTARLVVGADGRNSRIAELAGVPAKVKPHGRFAYFAYFRDLPSESGIRSQMWFIEPDIAYSFPNDEGITLLAMMPARDKLDSWKSDIEGSFFRTFEGLPRAPAIREGKRVSPFLGMIEMPNTARPASRPGLAFIGDAALAADPLWGVGCGWAFQSAEWLVDCVAESLGGRGDLDHLGVQPLAHLGAAVVDQYRAVLVHVHQRAGLIEMRRRERDAELHGRQREAAVHVVEVIVRGVWERCRASAHGTRLVQDIARLRMSAAR